MQKDKFIHEDIWSVCNSAAKKLVALGLVVAVGGTCTVVHDNRLIACAQQPIHTIIDNGDTLVEGDGKTTVKGSGYTLVEGDGDTGVTGDGVTLVEGDGVTLVEGDGDTLVEGEGRTFVKGSGHTIVKGDGWTFVKGDECTFVEGKGRTYVLGSGSTFVNGYGETTVTGSGPTFVEGKGKTTVKGSGPTFVKGGGETTVTGDGVTLVDGDSRLTVRRAASLEVNPDIAVTLPDGKKFTTASTLAETIDSAIDEDLFDRASGQTVSDPEQIDTVVVGDQKCKLDKNAHYLQNILEWAMRNFNLTNQELMDAVQHLPAQVG